MRFPLATLFLCGAFLQSTPAAAVCSEQWRQLNESIIDQATVEMSSEINGETVAFKLVADFLIPQDSTAKVYLADPTHPAAEFYLDALTDLGQRFGIHFIQTLKADEAILFFSTFGETGELSLNTRAALAQFQPDNEKREEILDKLVDGGNLIVHTNDEKDISFHLDPVQDVYHVSEPRKFVGLRSRSGAVVRTNILGLAVFSLIGPAYAIHPKACRDYDGVLAFNHPYPAFQSDDLALIEFAYKERSKRR